MKLAGPHGGGYLLLALLPFALAAAALFLYLAVGGFVAIYGAYEIGLGWLW
jgi:hypothetical protein